jgi:hypothetical protein
MEAMAMLPVGDVHLFVSVVAVNTTRRPSAIQKKGGELALSAAIQTTGEVADDVLAVELASSGRGASCWPLQLRRAEPATKSTPTARTETRISRFTIHTSQPCTILQSALKLTRRTVGCQEGTDLAASKRGHEKNPGQRAVAVVDGLHRKHGPYPRRLASCSEIGMRLRRRC